MLIKRFCYTEQMADRVARAYADMIIGEQAENISVIVDPIPRLLGPNIIVTLMTLHYGEIQTRIMHTKIDGLTMIQIKDAVENLADILIAMKSQPDDVLEADLVGRKRTFRDYIGFGLESALKVIPNARKS